jgi:ribosomal protein S18 acetylase RimI-like enzyme
LQYEKEVFLKDGVKCLLRGAREADAAKVLRTFNLTHTETDYLLTYPEENSFTVGQEAEFLKARNKSDNAIEIAAFIDGRIVGTAGIDPVGDKEKVRHRADFGIAIEKACWGRGIGRALTLACIECAKRAGYLQIELEVVAENASAVRLYESVGFREYGRNPRGFCARSGWQTLILMRLELDS